MVPCRWSNSPRKSQGKHCVYPAITAASLFAVVPVHKSEVSQGSGGQRLSTILPLLWGNKEFPVTPGLTFEGSLQAGVRKSQFKQPVWSGTGWVEGANEGLISLWLGMKKNGCTWNFPPPRLRPIATPAPPPLLLLNKSSQPQGLWLPKFYVAFTVAFSILTHFLSYVRLLLQADGNKVTLMINSYALDLVIYCSAWRRSGVGGWLEGSRPFEAWHQKCVEWPQFWVCNCGKPTLRSYIVTSNVILMKDGRTLFFCRRREAVQPTRPKAWSDVGESSWWGRAASCSSTWEDLLSFCELLVSSGHRFDVLVGVLAALCNFACLH